MTPEPTNPKQEIAELVRKSSRILLTAHSGPDADAVGSLLALTAALRKLGKQVFPVLSDPVPEPLKFLSGSDQIKPRFEGGKELHIEIPTGQTPVESLRYLTEGEKLQIVIEPKADPIPPETVSIRGGGGEWDLMIVLDSPNLAYVGDIGAGDRRTRPIANIDHHPTNERFGSVNWTDSEASSTSELLLSLIESLDPKLLDAEIAGNLYAGLLGDTGGFQNRNTSSKSLSVSAQLIAAGADHPKLVSELLRPARSAEVLRLWGQALSNLRLDPDSGLAWSRVSYGDIREEGAPESWGSASLMNQLLGQVTGARAVLLLTEPEPGIVNASFRVSDSTEQPVDLLPLVKHYGGGGHARAAGFRLSDTSLDEVITKVLPDIMNFIQTGQLPLAQTKPQAAPSRPQNQAAPETKVSSPEPKTVPAASADRPVPTPVPAPRVDDPESGGEILVSETERVVPKPETPEIATWRPGN